MDMTTSETTSVERGGGGVHIRRHFPIVYPWYPLVPGTIVTSKGRAERHRHGREAEGNESIKKKEEEKEEEEKI